MKKTSISILIKSKIINYSKIKIMKHIRKILSLLVLLIFIAMQGTSSYTKGYYAVYMERKNLEKSVFYIPEGREMKNPGKIYSRQPYLFVNEKYKGVHVIDNTDPSNPVKKGFIMAPGCLDMAVKGNILYLDNAVDLVSFDLTETEMKEVNRIRNVLPEPAFPNGYIYDYDNRPENLVLVEWRSN
jgi:hypothetical protein